MPDSPTPQLGTDGLIVEGIVTTFNVDGSINVAPMGPLTNDSFTTLILRPFRTSTTFENLCRDRRGVFHVVDDVEMIAKAAIGPLEGCEFRVDNPLVLADACRWYDFVIDEIDDSADRTLMIARTIDSGSQREFLGFNRAKHAVVEAAILATRVNILPSREILADFGRLQIVVDKTGSAAEQRAFALLEKFVEQALTAESCVERSAS